MSFLMDSSSSSLTHTRRYHVFPSFHGQDVRKRFLSHVHNYFASKGIITFKDHKIERGHTIGPELVQAISESRVSIVVLSKNYASSSWCLDELVEIFKCEEDFGQSVMTIFYDVDPSDVRKQIGDFGKAFEKTCEGKSEEVKQRWSQALARVATIAGEHSLNWANEAEMIQKIATDVSNKLNLTPSRDFEGMVGLEAHLNKLDTLLCLWCDDVVKIIGIWGPAGIGKTTIARALYNQISISFQLKCFMGNLKESCKSLMVSDDYDFKLCLQSKLLSDLLNQKDMKVHHLGAIKEWLQDQRVLIILDDVDNLEQLKALAKEVSWFGSGSRIIVTTEDKKTLKVHGIQDIYHVGFPSKKEALEILSLSAFKQRSVQEGFEELANKVVDFCGNLPLGLSVVGSSLRGESKEEWELQLSRIESSVDREIEDVLRVGYDKLSKKYQSLFLHIACFSINGVVCSEQVISLLADSNLDVENGLKTLANKSLMSMFPFRWMKMHHLLQQLGRQIVLEQSNDPGKRQFLVETDDILEVLRNETGTGSVIGIYLQYDKVGEFSISKRAFQRMPNLRFLRIYFPKDKLQIPDLNYLPRLKFLRWSCYPRESLPSRFQTDCLVELHMNWGNLKKLWGGIKPLPNLKIINLSDSYKLKEIPNLSKATNLESLVLSACYSLVEIHSSISNLHKLKFLKVYRCYKLKVFPANINLASLEHVDMSGCSQLRKLPDISTNISYLYISDTMIEDVPPSIAGWSRLQHLKIGSRSLKSLTHAPLSIISLDLSKSDLKSIPDCVGRLMLLKSLDISECPKLLSIQDLPPLLMTLKADNCVSLKRVCCSFANAITELSFRNCLKLDEESRRGIIQHSIDMYGGYIYLPGKEVPEEYTHKARGNSVTISLTPGSFSASSIFKACIQIFPRVATGRIWCKIRSNGGETLHRNECSWFSESHSSEHLFIFQYDLSSHENRYHEMMSEITFELCLKSFHDNTFESNVDIIECGVEIVTEETEGSSCSSKVDNNEIESSSIEMDSCGIKGNNNHNTYEAKGLKLPQVENIKTNKHTGCWSWLRKLGLKEKKMNKTERNLRGIS